MKIQIKTFSLNQNVILINTEYGDCSIELEPEVSFSLAFQLNNINKPLPSIWDFTKKFLENDITEYYIKKKIESDYYGILIDISNNEFPLRISDAIIFSSLVGFPIYIESDLLNNKELPIEFQLENALKEENYSLADKLQKQIDEKNKKK